MRLLSVSTAPKEKPAEPSKMSKNKRKKMKKKLKKQQMLIEKQLQQLQELDMEQDEKVRYKIIQTKVALFRINSLIAEQVAQLMLYKWSR